ncbi:MAG: methyltransferase domain-containing protein [Solirubrobacteraceae bacterium]
MSWSVHHRDRCRLCGSPDVMEFLSLGDAPFTDDFVAPPHAGREFRAPLSVWICRSCWTAQTQHDVSVDEYYRDYNYSVAASPFAQRFMQRLAEETWGRYGLGPGATVLEVGSGDGAQLAHFQALGARVLGFEPSADLCAASRAIRVPVHQCLFDARSAAEIPDAMRPVDAIVLTYTFDHLPEPLPFLQAVRSLLRPESGVLVIEVHDLEQIMARRETCLFEHEHSVYLTRRSFRRLLKRAGFELLTAELLPAQERRGNSLLVVAALEGSRHAPAPEDDGAEEFERWSTYAGFAAQVQRSHDALRDYVRDARATGRRIAGYGAGGRGVMTLAGSGLGPDDLAYLCDSSPHAHGLLAPGSHVPICGPARLSKEPVDELIVFSYGYMGEIREQLADELPVLPQLTSVLDLLRPSVA